MMIGMGHFIKPQISKKTMPTESTLTLVGREELKERIAKVKQVLENVENSLQFTNIPVYVLTNYIKEILADHVETRTRRLWRITSVRQKSSCPVMSLLSNGHGECIQFLRDSNTFKYVNWSMKFVPFL